MDSHVGKGFVFLNPAYLDAKEALYIILEEHQNLPLIFNKKDQAISLIFYTNIKNYIDGSATM